MCCRPPSPPLHTYDTYSFTPKHQQQQASVAFYFVCRVNPCVVGQASAILPTLCSWCDDRLLHQIISEHFFFLFHVAVSSQRWCRQVVRVNLDVTLAVPCPLTSAASLACFVWRILLYSSIFVSAFCIQYNDMKLRCLRSCCCIPMCNQ